MPNRKIDSIEYSTRYLRSLKKLPRKIQQQSFAREKMFLTDCFDPRLKTHKLRGRFGEYWAYSVNQKYRVIFRFADGVEALFFDIGSHAIYQ